MKRPRRRWLRSLTSKLVIGVVGLVVALVVLVGTTTFFALQSFLSDRLDQQASSTSAQNAAYLYSCLAIGPTNSSNTCLLRGPPPTTAEYLIVLTSDGDPVLKPTAGARNLFTLNLSSGQKQTIVNDPTQVHEMTVDGVKLRVGSEVVRDYIVATGLPENDIDRTMRRLVIIELIIGAGAVVLAFGATFWGVQRSLNNLYQVTGTAREVTAELSPKGAGLDRRVPVVEEGTEVGQLAESVNTLLSAIETQFKARLESEQRMRQFLADASHELRTPLTSIRGYAELARMQRAVGDVGAEDNLHRIESEGTRMSRLVEDLLMLARTDSAENARALEREPVDVVTLLDDVASASRAAFPDRRIDVAPLPVPTVLGDRDKLLRVVRNLVTNACVHTRPEAPIMVRCYPNAGGAEIQVIDGGPGLSPEEASHVFERFWRADKARTRSRGGSGLGLSIVDTIIRAHGGAVRFDSSVETGSTVSVWLPPAGADAVTPDADGAGVWGDADALACD